MLKLKRLAAAFSGYLLAGTIYNVAIAGNHEDSGYVASSSQAMNLQDSEKSTVPLDLKFSRAFGVPADGSWVSPHVSPDPIFLCFIQSFAHVN